MQNISSLLRKHKRWAGSLIVYGSVLFFAWQGGRVDMHWIAFAADPSSGNSDIIKTLSILLKVIYIILRPLLVVAGMAMDNSLVLGQVFHLDKPLWQFRRMMTNFANFALGFLVIYHILKYIFGFDDSTKDVFDIIKKALIAGVGIQASRFVMLAMLDISTVMTYSIGSLPMTVFSSTVKDKPILEMTSLIDYQKVGTKDRVGKDMSFELTFGCGSHSGYEYCRFQSGYLLGSIDEEKEYCVLGGIYATGNVVHILPKHYIAMCDGMPAYKDDTGVEWKNNTEETLSEAIKKANEDTKDRGCSTMGNMINKSKGMVKPLVTIYSSLLDFASINITDNNGTTGGIMIVFVLKTLIALMLFVPLILLALLLLLRVGFMWFYIVLLPFYVIKRSFKLDALKFLDANDSDTIGGVFKAIFMPVVVVFALSMGLIFLHMTVDVMHPEQLGKSSLSEEFGIYKNSVDGKNGESCMNQVVYGIGGQPYTAQAPITLELKQPQNHYGASMFRDFFSYILVNLFAIGVMRLLYFAAASRWKAGESILGVKQRQEKVQKLLAKAPIVPIPGGGGVGLGTAFNLNPSDSRGLLGKAASLKESQRGDRESAAVKEFMADKHIDKGKESSAVNKKFIDGSHTTYNDAARAGLRSIGKGTSDRVDYLNDDRIKDLSSWYHNTKEGDTSIGLENTAENKAKLINKIRSDIESQTSVKEAQARYDKRTNGGFDKALLQKDKDIWLINNQPYRIKDGKFTSALSTDEEAKQYWNDITKDIKTKKDIDKLNKTVKDLSGNQYFTKAIDVKKTFIIQESDKDGNQTPVTYARDDTTKKFIPQKNDTPSPSPDKRLADDNEWKETNLQDGFVSNEMKKVTTEKDIKSLNKHIKKVVDDTSNIYNGAKEQINKLDDNSTITINKDGKQITYKRNTSSKQFTLSPPNPTGDNEKN